jgi:hypothetical protein
MSTDEKALETEALLAHTRAMRTVLQIESLTRAEKLRAMEELWDGLRRTEDEYKSPDWHGEVLRDREAALNAGTAEFVPWEEAKRILRERAQ